MLFYTYSNKNKFERRQKPKFSCYYIFAQSTAVMSHHFVTRSHTMRRNTVPSFLSSRTADFQVEFNCLCKSNINGTLSTRWPMFTSGLKDLQTFHFVGISTCHKETCSNRFFSYFTLAGNSEERLTDLFCKLKTTVVTCTIELDLWTSHRSNLCFDFAVLQEYLGPGGGGGGGEHQKKTKT